MTRRSFIQRVLGVVAAGPVAAVAAVKAAEKPTQRWEHAGPLFIENNSFWNAPISTVPAGTYFTAISGPVAATYMFDGKEWVFMEAGTHDGTVFVQRTFGCPVDPNDPLTAARKEFETWG